VRDAKDEDQRGEDDQLQLRSDDELALAIDFHHSSAGTHLARFRRCPIPVKKA
jgi:hypothetical protein